MPLTEDETKQLATLLNKLETGQDLPEPVFFEFARLQCLPVIELVPLRNGERGVEVLLIERPADDPFFAGQVHNPGTIVRAKDQTIENVIERLVTHELPGTAFAGELTYVATQLHTSKRGNEWATIYYAELADSAGHGNWYPADNLPANLIESQVDFIRQAIDKFKQDTVHE